MKFVLEPIAVRVLGALIEKEVTTPDYYPLSLNALVNACNQKSNREPVMQLSEEEVVAAIDVLKDKKLLWQRSVTGARVFKYEHNIKSLFPLNDREMGVLCTLMLRGPQTIGEIRIRSERLCTFESLDDAEKVIRGLIAREDGPFILELPRQHGHKETRFVHLFSGEEWAAGQGAIGDLQSSPAVMNTGSSLSERISALEMTVSALQEELGEVRREFETFRKMLE